MSAAEALARLWRTASRPAPAERAPAPPPPPVLFGDLVEEAAAPPAAAEARAEGPAAEAVVAEAPAEVHPETSGAPLAAAEILGGVVAPLAVVSPPRRFPLPGDGLRALKGAARWAGHQPKTRHPTSHDVVAEAVPEGATEVAPDVPAETDVPAGADVPAETDVLAETDLAAETDVPADAPTDIVAQVGPYVGPEAPSEVQDAEEYGGAAILVPPAPGVGVQRARARRPRPAGGGKLARDARPAQRVRSGVLLLLMAVLIGALVAGLLTVLLLLAGLGLSSAVG